MLRCNVSIMTGNLFDLLANWICSSTDLTSSNATYFQREENNCLVVVRRLPKICNRLSSHHHTRNRTSKSEQVVQMWVLKRGSQFCCSYYIWSCEFNVAYFSQSVCWTIKARLTRKLYGFYSSKLCRLQLLQARSFPAKYLNRRHVWVYWPWQLKGPPDLDLIMTDGT